MDRVFEIIDRQGRKIRLTKKQWKHIIQDHPEMSGREHEIQDALENPLKISNYEYDKNVKYYYRYYKTRKINRYLLVLVKYLNGKGFIITAYYLRNIRR